MVKPIGTPTRPVNEMLKIFAQQTKEDLLVNMMTQRIWPYEVYPGYREVNEKRRREGLWYSTGRAAKTFDAWVENDDPYHMTIVAEMMDYMQYVDIGVGIWSDNAGIDRSKKGNYAVRYNKWDVGGGRTHRPAIMMQLRHLQTRMRQYAVDFYGYEGAGKVFNTFDGIVLDIWDGIFNLKNPKELMI